MNVGAVRILLWCVAGTCSCAAVLIAVGAALIPPDAPPPPPDLNAAAAWSAGASQVARMDLSAVMDVELRRPLVDQPAPTPAARIEAPLEPSSPAFHLTGTIVEPGHSLALFTDSAGKTEFKRVGDQTQGATVLSIRETGATLQWNRRQIVVPVDRPGVAKQPAASGENDRQ